LGGHQCAAAGELNPLHSSHPLRILSLEDDPNDSELIQELFEAEGFICRLSRVDSEPAFRALLQQGDIDLILADYTLPGFDGLSALKVAMALRPEVPFLFVTGTLGEETAIEALKVGATDYVLKTRLSRLVPSALRALREAREVAERKQAEKALRRSESYLAEAQRLTRTGSWVWSNAAGRSIHWSQEHFRLFGFDPAKGLPTDAAIHERIHAEDRDWVRKAMFDDQADFDIEYRIVLPGGATRFIRAIGHPVFDPSGRLLEYVGTAMDVTQQREARTALENAFAEIKTLKDQLLKENIALREEIVQNSMFEEIVGESATLQTVLSRVSKVGPTDSTALVTGETGTGKELIARAIHKLSPRSARAFVSVNCAAIPSSLISSELFGHEKGAFTGAIQRRLGRFELAEGGTIFLDEVGELPQETQIALLRVLQERTFERVGGNKVIHANVRVIAATNRNLQHLIEDGAFRSDLYYRLNVFPIEMPPLRQRREDIPLLVEYFIDRYASKTGKKIRRIESATLERLKSYNWPGNIRELQNVIERSMVLCESELFKVDASWLSVNCDDADRAPRTLLKLPAAQEKKAIEAALADAQGQVSGPSGAAARLGIPASTLDSKIRAFKINKYRFKTS
jgi:DNA-binding NtrC family response regulator